MTAPVRAPHPAGSSRSSAILITGAGGEVGHGLIRALYEQGARDIVAIDIRELEPEIRAMCARTFVGDICDAMLLGRLLAMYEVYEIFHLAALLSTRSEFTPETAHDVNVGGTIGLLRLAAEQARSHGKTVKFVFPSSIAAYGVPDLTTKARAGRVREDQFVEPTTMYGCNKLYCEHLGRYYAKHYRQLAKDRVADLIDFRCVRFPGLISADTVPSGGTSDYAPEMIHAAAKNEPYACFVRADTRIPFLTMPDAIDALLALAHADQERLSRQVYNLSAFAPTAGQIADLVRAAFPNARISFQPDVQRQGIVDSWPEDVDDSAARRDFGFVPKHDVTAAFRDYLVPAIKARYAR
ncbi:MAG: NAD-dependent epimerase/dehydratase family protein [Planctomycetes bacterium]|nr:NAD-dependent epimerase/dehydratase family protein [Planctomycetota bacterium]